MTRLSRMLKFVTTWLNTVYRSHVGYVMRSHCIFFYYFCEISVFLIHNKEKCVLSKPHKSTTHTQKKNTMVTLYFKESHTVASALRLQLEAVTSSEDFVSCTLMHPLDDHLEVQAPSEKQVREALLRVKERVAENRKHLQRCS
jgi:hypothetical protein